MQLPDADRRRILVLLEQIRGIIRGPVGAEPPMAGDVVDVANSYAGYGNRPDCNSTVEAAARAEKAPVLGGAFIPQFSVVAEPDTDGSLGRQAADTARGSAIDTDGPRPAGVYAGSWCRHGTRCPHPNVCQLAIGGCTDRQDRYRDLK